MACKFISVGTWYPELMGLQIQKFGGTDVISATNCWKTEKYKQITS